jgi:hypothetical protein
VQNHLDVNAWEISKDTFDFLFSQLDSSHFRQIKKHLGMVCDGPMGHISLFSPKGKKEISFFLGADCDHKMLAKEWNRISYFFGHALDARFGKKVMELRFAKWSEQQEKEMLKEREKEKRSKIQEKNWKKGKEETERLYNEREAE